MASAFDDEDQYVLTALGQQFVHYAMTELTPKITYQDAGEDSGDGTPNISEPSEAAA